MASMEEKIRLFIEDYKTSELSTGEIYKKHGFQSRVALRLLKIFNIPPRPKGTAQRYEQIAKKMNGITDMPHDDELNVHEEYKRQKAERNGISTITNVEAQNEYIDEAKIISDEVKKNIKKKK